MDVRVFGTCAGLLAALSCGCAAQRSISEAASGDVAVRRSADVATERDEFVRGAREWLDELNDTVVVLAVKLHDLGNEEQRERWGELLFRLKHERRHLDAEILDARDAPLEAWDAREGALREQVDRLSAAVDRTAAALALDLEGSSRAQHAELPFPVEVDLCQVQVTGTNAELQQQGDLLVVQLNASSREAVADLQRRAELELLRRTSSELHAGEQCARPDAPPQVNGAGPTASQLQKQDTPNGVVFIFAPTPGQLAALKARLEQTTEQIDEKGC